MEIKFEKHICPYGKALNYGKGLDPIVDEDRIIVYNEINKNITAPIGTLEGFFVSEIPILESSAIITEGCQLLIKRNQMQFLEEKYGGKFVSF